MPFNQASFLKAYHEGTKDIVNITHISFKKLPDSKIEELDLYALSFVILLRYLCSFENVCCINTYLLLQGHFEVTVSFCV